MDDTAHFSMQKAILKGFLVVIPLGQIVTIYCIFKKYRNKAAQKGIYFLDSFSLHNKNYLFSCFKAFNESVAK